MGERVNPAKFGCHPRNVGDLDGLYILVGIVLSYITALFLIDPDLCALSNLKILHDII